MEVCEGDDVAPDQLQSAPLGLLQHGNILDESTVGGLHIALEEHSGGVLLQLGGALFRIGGGASRGEQRVRDGLGTGLGVGRHLASTVVG